MKKLFYKSWWFWAISVFAFLLFVGNILLAHFYKSDGANIFTAVSGWVSGIATAILGFFALWQNKRFLCESKKQSLIQEAFYFINEEQQAFFNFFEMVSLFSIADKIIEARSEQDSIERANKQLNLLSIREELMKNIFAFQMVLTKSLICKDEIVLLDSLLDKFVTELREFQNDPETDLGKLKNRIYNATQDFCMSALQLQKTILIKYQQLKYQLLGEEKSKSILQIENDILEEKRAISAYFEESITKDDNKET